jgi:glutaconate CoA-transferase subunit B
VRADGRLVRFPGGLALGDVVNLMPRIVLYHTAHEPRALPERVGFRTAAGGGIERGGYRAEGATTLVTDRAVIRLAPSGARLVSFHPGDTVGGVVEATGFALAIDGAVETPPPTDDELEALESVDPDRHRDREFKRRRANA